MVNALKGARGPGIGTLSSIYMLRQKLKRVTPGLDPYVSPERYFEYSWVLQSLSHLPAGSPILDIGSGDSLLPSMLADRGYVVTCADPFELVARQSHFARGLGVEQRMHAIVANGNSLPFKAASFEAVVCISALEHMPNCEDQDTVKEACRLLVPGGLLCMSFPWQKYYYEYWGTEPLYIDQHEELKLITRFYSPDSLAVRLLGESGMKLMHGVKGKRPEGRFWLERLLRLTPVPGLADLYRGSRYIPSSLGDEELHQQYTAMVIARKEMG